MTKTNKGLTIIENRLFEDIYNKAYDEAVEYGETEESEELFKLITNYKRKEEHTRHCWYIKGYPFYNEANEEIIESQQAVLDFIEKHNIQINF